MQKAMNSLETMKMNSMDKTDKIVGGHHPQADKFRTFFNWLLQGGAKVFIPLYLSLFRLHGHILALYAQYGLHGMCLSLCVYFEYVSLCKSPTNMHVDSVVSAVMFV